MNRISFIPWYGGKYYMLKHLLPLIPQHTIYLEPFCGSAKVLLAKEPSKVEVINDLHSDLVNLYRVVRDPDQCRELIRRLEFTPYSREEWHSCRLAVRQESDPVERARMFYVVIRQSYGGCTRGHSWGVGGINSNNSASKFQNAIGLLPQIMERLQKVTIECQDAFTLLARWDSPKTFIYLDPPYVLSSRAGDDKYAHELTDGQHEQLINFCLSAKSKIMLSGYAHPIYQPLEDAGWKRLDFPQRVRIAARSHATSDLSRTETVWVNY